MTVTNWFGSVMFIPELPVVTRLVQDEMPKVTPPSPFVLRVEHSATDVAPEGAPLRHQQARNAVPTDGLDPGASHDDEK